MILLTLAGLLIFAIIVVLFGFFTSADRSVLLSRYKTFAHDGIERTYLIVGPGKVSDETILVVGLHGFGGNARQHAYYTAMHNTDPDAVFVYPNAIESSSEGLKSGWNAKFCCGAGWQGEVDDVGFIRELSTSIASELGIAKDSLFVSGFSNGAFMTQRIAAETPDTFKAAASVSGAIGANGVDLIPEASIPILLSHGKKDAVIPFNGGTGTTDPDFAWRTHDETVAVWEAVNAGDAAAVESIVYPEDTHRWHDWRLFNIWHRQPEGSKQVMDFFRSQ